MLFCLVVLPHVVGIDALERAFEALCSVQGRSTAGNAFENALAALDDSMIRTLHTNRGVQVTPHSPSVVDYVRGYLVDSPGDGAALLDSAPFWEQVEAMWSLIAAPQVRLCGDTLGARTSRRALHRLARAHGAARLGWQQPLAGARTGNGRRRPAAGSRPQHADGKRRDRADPGTSLGEPA